MNRKQKIIVSVTGLFLVLLILMGLTYAYFLTRITGNTNDTSISVTTENLALVYGDDDGSIIGDGEIIEPGVTFETKTFSVTNVGTAKTDYVVVIDDVNVTWATDGTYTDEEGNQDSYSAGMEVEEGFKSNDFIYTLECESECYGVEDAILPMEDGILIGNIIEEGETQTYSFTLTYKDTKIDQSADMNKVLSGRLNIANIKDMAIPYEESTLAYKIINNAKNVTSAEKKENYAELRSTSLTKLGEQGNALKYDTVAVESTTDNEMTISTSVQKYFWTYGTGYKIDPDTGKFELTGVSTCQYNDGTCHEKLVNNYIVAAYSTGNSNNTDIQKSTSNLTNIYKVILAPESSSSSIKLKYRALNKKILYSSENILSISHDDYGLSYYYRGDVTNNYLNFNGMCWRIVRIEGDGSIKLTLEDYDEECSSSMTGKFYIGGANYGYIQNSVNSASGTTYSINFINFSGGMADKLESFQNEKLSSVISRLKAGDWCYDDKKYEDEEGLKPLTDPTPYYENDEIYYYGSYIRLNNYLKMTLLCKGKKLEKFRTDTEIYAGALTAEEVAYAGAGPNGQHYLRKSANGQGNWLTLSPAYYGNGALQDVAFGSSGSSLNGFAIKGSSYYYLIRPAISLLSDVYYVSGDGTIDNPYAVE